MTKKNRKRRGSMSYSSSRSLLTLIAAAAVACTETSPAPDDVSGTYVGTAAVRSGASNAAAPDTVDAPDTATYTLRIREADGFAYGVWTIAGDTAQPTDPWDAVINGAYTEGSLVLEYHSPTLGQCHLAGTVADDLYMAEHRCATDWSAADTLQLAWVPSACPPGSEVWSGLSVCGEHDREGYDRDAFGTGYRSLEDEIIDSLPKNASADSVYTPYTCKLYEIEEDGTAATDIDHIVALAEAYDSGLREDLYKDFGKDIDNLTVADPTVNRHRKSDKDATEWRPAENAGWYASRIVAVKLKYGLSVNSAERDSLVVFLEADSSRMVTCP